jgi:hypothetical protein
VPAIRVWGEAYRRIGRAESDYHTLAGTVRVMRTVYRKTVRNGDTLDPVSVRAGVVADGWLPHTARAMAYLLAQGTSREAEVTGRELARLPYSRSSFERVGHEVGTLYRRSQARIEEVLIQEYAVPAEARSVSISIDRVALPMEELIEAPSVPVDPPWVAAAMAAAPPHPPEVQAVLDEQTQGDGPKVARNFRMAYAATVALHDAEGESIHTIRYGRMPKGDVRGLCRGLARDVTAMRAQRPDLKVAYLTDGAIEFETAPRAGANGSDEDWRRNAGLFNQVRILEPHPTLVDISRVLRSQSTGRIRMGALAGDSLHIPLDGVIEASGSRASRSFRQERSTTSCHPGPAAARRCRSVPSGSVSPPRQLAACRAGSRARTSAPGRARGLMSSW